MVWNSNRYNIAIVKILDMILCKELGTTVITRGISCTFNLQYVADNKRLFTLFLISAKASIMGGSTSQGTNEIGDLSIANFKRFSHLLLLQLAEDMLGLSFQLASLEENAVINIWVSYAQLVRIVLFSIISGLQ